MIWTFLGAVLVLTVMSGAVLGAALGLTGFAILEIFGGGVNAFSRYETGKTKPPLALVKLFKLLDRHPDLLNEVRLI